MKMYETGEQETDWVFVASHDEDTALKDLLHDKTSQNNLMLIIFMNPTSTRKLDMRAIIIKLMLAVEVVYNNEKHFLQLSWHISTPLWGFQTQEV